MGVRTIALAALVMLAAACAAPNAATPVPSPAVMVSTASAAPPSAASPIATPGPIRPSPLPGAPAIAEPYWLLANGTGVNTVTAADGTVLVTERSDNYKVIDGGSLEDGILINGDWIGLLERTLTEGTQIAGLNPIEQQYGAQLDAETPNPAVLPPRSPNPYWVRSTDLRRGLTVYIRVPSGVAGDPSAQSSEAFWWDADGEHWYRLSVDGGADFDAVLTALLGP